MPNPTTDSPRSYGATAGPGAAGKLLALVDTLAQAHRLSERERQVLHLTVLGACSKEVAQALDCSVKTVETYWKRLLRKLDVGCRHAFLAWIIACALDFEPPKTLPGPATSARQERPDKTPATTTP